MNKNKSNRDFAANRVRKTRLKFEPDSEVTPKNSNEGEEDFTENIFREAVNHMDARRQHKESLESVTKATHPFGILFHAVKTGTGKAFQRSLPGQLASRFHDMLKERNAIQRQIEAENERNAILTTVVATGACTLAAHFEKLHIITSPLIWFSNGISHLLGNKAPLFITKVVSYKKTEYFALGVQMQYQLIFMIGIFGISWYLTFRIICWFNGIISPDDRLKM